MKFFSKIILLFGSFVIFPHIGGGAVKYQDEIAAADVVAAAFNVPSIVYHFHRNVESGTSTPAAAAGVLKKSACYSGGNNTISEEDRRAAISENKIKLKSRLRPSETRIHHRFYFPSAHESSGINAPDTGRTYGGHNTGYANGGPHYYVPTGPDLHPTGHSFGGFGVGHGGVYDGGEHGGGYGLINGGGQHGISSGHNDGSHKALALKAILIPLAGIALLGAAAALSTNPVLLQLGVLNGRRRRRRSLMSASGSVYPGNPNVKPDSSS